MSSREIGPDRKRKRTKTPSKRSSCTKTARLEQPHEDSDSDLCPICLRKLKTQTLAVTDSCSHHVFCLICLEEWSKTRFTCPVDRKEFDSILVLDSKGRVSRQLPIQSCLAGRTSPSASAPCEACGLFTNPDLMMTCDGCGTGYHAYCLNLLNPSRGVWLCEDCWFFYNF